MSPDSTTLDTVATESTTKPVKVFRDGRLSVSVFRNPATVRGEERIFHNCYLQRTYKDGDTYKTTNGLGKDDLPKAQLLLTQAWTWVVNDEHTLRQKIVKRA